jgi:hypothetical protein
MKAAAVPESEEETREMFESLYRYFNARDIDAILCADVRRHRVAQ